jgi:hypothetical protein
MNARSRQGMLDRGVRENVARPGAQVAVEVPACLCAVGGAGCSPVGLPNTVGKNRFREISVVSTAPNGLGGKRAGT